MGPLRTIHRRHPTLRTQHRKTLVRNRHRTTSPHARNLPSHLHRPLHPRRRPPRPRHRLEPGDIDTLTGYAGTKYGVPTEAAYAAIHLVAKTEAIILDPNYTGKSMSALIALIRTRNLDPKTPIIFIHSGGQPQTFAFPNQLSNREPQ